MKHIIVIKEIVAGGISISGSASLSSRLHNNACVYLGAVMTSKDGIFLHLPAGIKTIGKFVCQVSIIPTAPSVENRVKQYITINLEDTFKKQYYIFHQHNQKIKFHIFGLYFYLDFVFALQIYMCIYE